MAERHGWEGQGLLTHLEKLGWRSGLTAARWARRGLLHDPVSVPSRAGLETPVVTCGASWQGLWRREGWGGAPHTSSFPASHQSGELALAPRLQVVVLSAWSPDLQLQTLPDPQIRKLAWGSAACWSRLCRWS